MANPCTGLRPRDCQPRYPHLEQLQHPSSRGLISSINDILSLRSQCAKPGRQAGRGKALAAEAHHFVALAPQLDQGGVELADGGTGCSRVKTFVPLGRVLIRDLVLEA